MDQKKNPDGDFGIKSKIMSQIKEGKVKMRSPLVFLAEKTGLESAAAAGVIFGALALSLVLYLLEKGGAFRFLSFGPSGIKVFLMAVPYGYLFLFVLAVLSAVYFADRTQIFCGECRRTNVFASYFLPLAVVLGVIFFAMGTGAFFKDWKAARLPEEIAIHGKIISVSEGKIVIENLEGKRTTIIFPRQKEIRGWKSNPEGEFLWAVGWRDGKDKSFFHAEEAGCCQ